MLGLCRRALCEQARPPPSLESRTRARDRKCSGVHGLTKPGYEREHESSIITRSLRETLPQRSMSVESSDDTPGAQHMCCGCVALCLACASGSAERMVDGDQGLYLSGTGSARMRLSLAVRLTCKAFPVPNQSAEQKGHIGLRATNLVRARKTPMSSLVSMPDPSMAESPLDCEEGVNECATCSRPCHRLATRPHGRPRTQITVFVGTLSLTSNIRFRFPRARRSTL